MAEINCNLAIVVRTTYNKAQKLVDFIEIIEDTDLIHTEVAPPGKYLIIKVTDTAPNSKDIQGSESKGVKT